MCKSTRYFVNRYDKTIEPVIGEKERERKREGGRDSERKRERQTERE